MRVLLALIACSAFCAELPRVKVDTTLPAVTGATVTVAADCSDLQTKINAAALGDAIVIPAGITCTGSYTLKNKTSGSGWITIRTSEVASLPAGVRVNPTQAAFMPKIQSANSSAAIATEANAHHYRLIGLEITVRSDVALSYDAVSLGDGSEAQNSLDLVPSYLVMDRCYVHGNPHQQVRRGVALNSAHTAIIDSYVSDWHTTDYDSQATGGWNGPGPFLIRNNYLEAAGENIQMGGARNWITDLVPSDIEVLCNTFYKPLTWRVGDPSYLGDNFSIKNIFELKNARRVLIEGNVFERNWLASQTGYSILFTVRTETVNTWNEVSDITFRDNIVRHVAGAVDILGHDTQYGGGIAQRITVLNNLFDDVSSTAWGSGSEYAILLLDGPPNVSFDRNSIIGAGNALVAIGDAGAPTGAGFSFTSNIGFSGTYGVFGSGAGSGTAALNTYFPGGVLTANVLIGGSASGYPTGNHFPAALANVGFVNSAAGNYRLLSTSAYRGLGPDYALLPLIEGVIVRPTDRAAVLSWSVTPALKTATCTVWLEGTAISDTPRSIGNLRTAVIGSLSASTAYVYRVQCGGAEQRGAFTTLAALSGTRSVSITRVAGVATSDFSWGYAFDGTAITGATTTGLECQPNTACTATFTADKGKPVYYRFGAGKATVLVP